VVAATASQARQLGAPYVAGDDIGDGGIEAAYQKQLAGLPALKIELAGPGSKVDRVLASFGGKAGTPVRTSIVMKDQLAAAAAVDSSATKKPVYVVALQPSTGDVRAVVERPGGFDAALQGTFPPGSTFKIVTASALAQQGLRPTSTVQCPSQATIGGFTFHNFDNEKLGTTSLLKAFAVSCNSTFALQATQRLDGRSLAATAREFGFNANAELGIPAILGKFQTPAGPEDLAADAFGQGTDEVNPLSQAAEAAAIQNGSWRPPLLVTSPEPRQRAAPIPLSTSVLGTLRPMMRAVVKIGTAAAVPFPPGVYGKTGTAEFDSNIDPKNPPSDAWFIGYRGDLAFAVVVVRGGIGAQAAGPIANSFLRHV